MNKLVSVIVPVYNVSAYLDRCIISIVNQTYKNIEIILIDDGSTDDSLSIIRKWEENDGRIKSFTKKNGGLSDARNFGIRKAKGDYYIFVDSDDVLNIHIIEHLLNICEINNTAMAICGYRKFFNETEISIIDVDNNEDNTVHIYDFRRFFHTYASGDTIKMITAWAKIYRKDLFVDIQYPVGRMREDEFTTYKLVDLSKTVAVSNAKYYYYFQREGSIMSGNNVKKCADYVIALYERDKFICEKYKDLAEEYGTFTLMHMYYSYKECLVSKYKEVKILKTMYKEIYNKYHKGLRGHKVEFWAIIYFPICLSAVVRTKRLIFKRKT